MMNQQAAAMDAEDTHADAALGQEDLAAEGAAQADAVDCDGDSDGAEVIEAAPEQDPYVAELEKKLADMQVQLNDKEVRLSNTLKQYKEALDEFESAKSRLRRDIGKEIESGKRSILGDLLDVLDNLERAVGSSQGVKENAEHASLLGGVSMVRDQFLAKLQALGVTRFSALNAPFDPSRCEAVSIVPVPGAEQDGVVVGVVRDCYLIGSETLRHGMVAVGKGPDVDKDAGAEQDQKPD